MYRPPTVSQRDLLFQAPQQPFSRRHVLSNCTSVPPGSTRFQEQDTPLKRKCNFADVSFGGREEKPMKYPLLGLQRFCCYGVLSPR